jgi:hypothetical protein
MKKTQTAALAGLLLASIPLASQPQFFSLDKKGAGGYYASVPEQPARSLVLLIPGPGQDPVQVFPDSANTALAHEKGIALVAIEHPGKLLLTPDIHRFLLQVVKQASREFGTEPDQTAVGGLGEGGLLALQFTAECQASPAFYPSRPRAVFCIDAPADLSAWWKSCEEDIRRNSSTEAVAQALHTQRRLAEELGGAQDTLAAVYIRRSPFSMEGELPGKEQLLVETGLRLYYHNDLSFQLRERGRTLYDLPIGPASSMVQSLLKLGNANASLELLPSAAAGGFNQAEWIYWLVESLGSK